LTHAYCTWTLTHGNSSIIVGVVDSEFDVDHEDLDGKFAYTSGTPSIYPCHHGTAVSGLIAAQTNNSIGTASLGYDTRVAGYFVSLYSDCTGNPFNQVWQAYLDDLRIINLSWTGIGSPPGGFPLTVVQAVQEMTENGVSLVCAAGNTPTATNHSAYANIPGVINVSGINYQNYHQSTGHAHNQWVDICALSDNATTTKPGDNYGGAWGTSFAAPQVCATIALMLSVNPNLTPEEIEDIIEETADPISDQSSYPGQLGAGKLNPYYAVLNANQTSYKAPSYSTGFEDGLDTYWKVYQSNNNGRTMSTDYGAPRTGDGHLALDVIYSGTYSTNEGWMHLNLSGKSNVALQFWWKETSDETHTQDGVYISDDGGVIFKKIYSLTGGSSTYQKVNIDLSDKINDEDMDHSSTFVVKFQQYDNYPMSTDGIAIDDIDVCNKPAQSSYITIPYEHCILDWEEYSCYSVSGVLEYDWSISGAGTYLREDGSRYVEVRAIWEGWYTLQVRAKNICDQWGDWKSRSIWIDNCGAKASSDLFIIKPNPAKDFVEVTLNMESKSYDELQSGGFTVDIYNQANVLLKQEKTEGSSIQIYVGDLINGVYVYRILYNKEIYPYEVIVQH